jgi:hypothetical protein
LSGTHAIRGARVGSGPMGELDHGARADRVSIEYWDALGNKTVRHFAADIAEEDIPDEITSPQSGLAAGRDKITRQPVQRTSHIKRTWRM